MSSLIQSDPPPSTSKQHRAVERRIDPRGHRFGAALSASVLVLAFVAQAPILAALIAVALLVSAGFGTQYSVLGRPWPTVRRLLGLGAPAELESEYPPRFAQALGATGLTLAVLLFATGLSPLAWLLVGAVAALQTVLAATGYCLGCRLYFLRWYVPGLFDRLIGRSAPNPLSLPSSFRRLS